MSDFLSDTIVECLFFWSAKTEKGLQRISLSCNLQLPFTPTKGLCISFGDNIPSVYLIEVVWDVQKQTFSVHGTCTLHDWTSSIFESLIDDLRVLGFAPAIHDDNWIGDMGKRRPGSSQ